MSDAGRGAANWRTRHIDVLLGQRVQALRAERGLSRADLARALRVSQPAIQHVEEGRNRISASQLWQVCGVLGVDANAMFDGLPSRIWRDRVEFERAASEMATPGVREEAAVFRPAQDSRDNLRLAKATKGLSGEQMAMLIAAARSLRG